MTLSSDRLAFLEAHRDQARQALLEWLRQQARDLPWRHERTPYRVWISEVMLQQTQVETVRGYYDRFLARFPTVEALAAAPLEDILKVWEGLGYYSRARSLHRAARQVVDTHGGQLPADVAALRDLPGIGPYTAGAIASIAFGIPEPAVDGNVRRVVARVLAMPEPSRQELEEAVRDWMPEETAGRFSEALMELGATICTPRSPDCPRCPWRDLCQARAQGEQKSYPRAKPGRTTPHYDVTAAVTLRQHPEMGKLQVLAAQRPVDAMLGGLWEFPGGKREKGESLPDCLTRELQEELDITVSVGEQLTVVQHAYTHFRITLYAFICKLVVGEPTCLECADFRWVTVEEIRALPMAVTDRKIAEALEVWLQNRRD